MPNINGKKINQLPDGKAVEDPLFVLGDQDGKAYNMGAQDLKDRMSTVTTNATALPSGTNLNSINTKGRYLLDKTIFLANGYFYSPFITKQGIAMPDDAILEVTTYENNRIEQRIIWPGSFYTVIARSYGQGNTNRDYNTYLWSDWAIVTGQVELLYYYDESVGGISPNSLNNLTEYDVNGQYFINICKRNINGTTENYSVTQADATSRGFPDITVFQSAAKFSAWVMFKIEYRYPNTRYSDMVQRLWGAWGSSEASLYTYIPYEFVKYGARTTAKWGNWLPYGMHTNNIMSVSAQNARDNTIKAGSATIPPFVFTPGVQAQNPVVKGGLNYDGTDFYYTDNAGNKHKITSTIV